MEPIPTTFGCIRDAREADTQDVLRMVARLAAHHGDVTGLSADTLMEDAFSETPWVHLLVAEAESGLVGYAALCKLVKLQFGARGFDLHHLYTEAEYRGQGVGTALVSACIEMSQAHSCSYLSVGTSPSNLEAQAFYLARGFTRRDGFPPRFRIYLDG